MYEGIVIDDAKECQMAGELKEFRKESNDKIANCFLVGAYVLKMKPKRIEYRKEFKTRPDTFS